MEFNFRPDREAHLRMLCEEMGRSVDDFVNEAILTFMEDYEDGRDAQAALREFEQGDENAVTLDDLMREYGLDAGDLTEGTQADRPAGQTHKDEDSQLPRKQTSHAA